MLSFKLIFAQLRTCRAILHDPLRYPDPDTFNPSRFLTLEGKLDRSVPDLAQFAFGFGRRICPGRIFATETIWLHIACILATMTIEKARDESGAEITPRVQYTPGLIRRGIGILS